MTETIDISMEVLAGFQHIVVGIWKGIHVPYMILEGSHTARVTS